MEGVFTSLSRLLWFFYRVFFTLIPSTIFVITAYVFIHYNFIDEQTALKSQSSIKTYLVYLFEHFQRLSPIWRVVMTLCVIVSVNVLIEGIVMKVAYNTLEFRYKTDKMFYPFWLNTVPDGWQNKPFPFAIYNLVGTKSLIKNNKVYEHIEYLLAREFLFNNSWILLLLGNALFMPHTLVNSIYSKSEIDPVFYILIEIGLSIIIAAVCNKMIYNTRYKELTFMYVHWLDSLPNELKSKCINVIGEDGYSGIIKKTKNRKKLTTLILILFILFSVSIIYWSEMGNNMNDMVRFYSMFLSINMVIFIFTYFLLSAAFREYVNIEKTAYAYYFIELSEENELNQKSKFYDADVAKKNSYPGE